MRIWRRLGLVITPGVIDHAADAIMKWKMMFSVPLDTCVPPLRRFWKAWPFLNICLWLSVASAVVLGSRSWSESLRSSLVALTLLIACIGSLGSSGADAFRSALHFKKSVLPKPCAGEYECLLINRRCVSHWDMNSTRAARETDIEVNPRSPLQAWY